ncbi:unnamed protein product [Brachionus calyciflorus]|uniref:Coiled-coil domain-containing protein 12 n=1 Tax=Brachionus calyciflorus TaxID=104777 RepID=A0A814F013_9BILA|nr:unnamed protein product [Brachionus calyciflorus]
MDSIGNLDQEALKRKERLKALREGQLKTLNQNNGDNSENSEIFPKPLFRNYTPKDDDLKSNILPKPDLSEIRDEIKEQLDSAKPKPLIEKEIDLATLAPQKIDWDLKRECEKKLKILERRTQKAIVEIIRDRLKASKNSDLAELVTVGSRGFKKNQNTSQGEESESDEESDEEQVDNLENNDQSSQDSLDSKEQNNVYMYEKHEISDEDDY